MTAKSNDRLHYVSAAVSFGNVDALQRHGSGAAELTCPACGATGTRYGNPGEDMRFLGFTPVTAGGIAGIVCTCHKCKAEVTLPHRRV